ncbi:MAG: pilus assembly protein PilM [Anaerovoracaceae bacterium]
MEISINIENDRIQMVEGKIKGENITVEAFYTVALERGVIINGIITNVDGFKSAVNELVSKAAYSKLKDVRIVLGGSPVLIKTKRIPKLTKSEMQEWIKGEFDESNQEDDELVYDYSLLEFNKEKGDNALLCAIKKSILESYINIFNEAGITISCIDIGLSCQIKMIDLIDETIGKTFVVLYLDGNNLNSALYTQGVFRGYNKTRLLSESGTDPLYDEIQQAISKMVQYNFAEKNEDPVESIYISGFNNESYVVKRLIEESGSYSVKFFAEKAKEIVKIQSDEFDLDEYLYATSNLIRE